MKPVLYRYRDSESVIKAMEGYTPPEGWEPLYDQAAINDEVKAERDAMLKDAERYRWLREHGDESCTQKDGYGGQELRTGERLDSAIDAAIAKGWKAGL